MLQQRGRNPIIAPVAAGTITQGRRQSEQAAALQREQMAQQERLQRAQMAQQERLARARAQAETATPSVAHVASLIKATTDAAARRGQPFSAVVQALQSPNSLGALQQFGMNVDDAVNLAKGYYEPTLRSGAFGQDVQLSLAEGPKNLMVPANRELRQNMFNRGIGFDATLANARQRALDSAIRDFQQFSLQQPQKIEEGAYRDPITGEIFHVDQWGNKTFPGAGATGGIGGLSNLGR